MVFAYTHWPNQQYFRKPHIVTQTII